MGIAPFLVNLGLGLVSTAVAAPLSFRVGIYPPEPVLALWVPATAFFGACAGLRPGCLAWERWIAILLNLGCVFLLGGFAGVAATGLFGFLALFPLFALGAALAAWNTVLLLRRALTQ